jgi:hypothetical protein
MTHPGTTVALLTSLWPYIAMAEETPIPPSSFARLNDRGLIEIVDTLTGRILCVQSSYKDLLTAKFERLTKIDTPQGPVWVEKGINFDIINHLDNIPYSRVLGDLLCQFIVEGATMVKAAKRLNLEYATVVRWQRENVEFRENLQRARIDRTEWIHDEILEKARTKATANVEIEALKWAAEKGNPDRYGPKQKNMEITGGVIQFIVNTGIDRTPIPMAEPKDVSPREIDGAD